MKNEVATRLCALNTDFYAKQAESFSETRNAPWHGWQRCAAIMADYLASNASAKLRCSVLDVACGNLRFEKFLKRESSDCEFDFHAVDNCIPLVESGHVGFPLEFEQVDVVAQLIDADNSEYLQLFGRNSYDFVCSFGFMHHIPGFDNRLAFVRQLVESAKPNGLVFLSFWRFMSNEKLAKKAIESTSRGVRELGFAAVDGERYCRAGIGCDWMEANVGTGSGDNGGNLEKNDYLLGWKDVPGMYRYCHHFDENEMCRIVNSIADCADVVDRFTADGKTDDLNEYLVLRARGRRSPLGRDPAD